jgi:hypothetical protein
MDETPDHTLRPVDDYHWNLLSMDQTKKLFAAHGFSAQVIQIKSFLRQELGCDYTHNPNAYTFLAILTLKASLIPAQGNALGS